MTQASTRVDKRSAMPQDGAMTHRIPTRRNPAAPVRPHHSRREAEAALARAAKADTASYWAEVARYSETVR